MVKLKKNEVNALIRKAGLEFVDVEQLEEVAGAYYGYTKIADETRLFQIKVTAKAEDFDLESLRQEEAIKAENKRLQAELTARKKERDAARRAAKKKEGE